MTVDEAIQFIEGHDLCTGFPRTAPRAFPEGTPADVVQFFSHFDRAYLFQTLVHEGDKHVGSRGTKNTVDLQPDFSESVFEMHADEMDADPDAPICQSYQVYKNCYTIGNLGAGNHQILLDLNGPAPRLIDFFYYPCLEYEECVELGTSFTEWLSGQLSFGPDRSYYDFVRFDE